MIEENNVFWLDSIRAGVLEVDSTALVSVGLFVPHGPNPARIGDARLVVGAPAIWQSTLDFGVTPDAVRQAARQAAGELPAGEPK